MTADCTRSIWAGRSAMTSAVARNSSEVRTRPAWRRAFVGDADPSASGGEGRQAPLRLGEGEEHRARELAVEDEEGGRPVVAEQLALAAHEGLLRPAA